MKNSKNNYPAQLGSYAVKVKNGGGWQQYSTARLQISVGQEYHEGAKFKATIEWAKHRFDKVVICVNDTLQRYNYMHKEGVSEVEAYAQSEVAGREWVERNINAIRSLPSCEIIRWNNWLDHPNFNDEHKFINDLYDNDEELRSLINADVLAFWRRKQIREGMSTYADFESFKRFSTEYLLEETAAFFLMFKKEKAVDIYPGTVLLPCVLVEKYLNISNRNLGSGAFTRIDFLRKNHTQTKQASA